MRRVVAIALGACLALTPHPLGGQMADPELAKGLQQVREGDFEGAVTTLESVVRRLAGTSLRKRELVQAYLQLGVAYVALDQTENARARFRGALTLDRKLELSPAQYSPKVLSVFEDARREVRPKGGGGGSRAALVGLGAAAAAVGVVLATRRGSEAAAGVSGARFGTPVVTCFDDSVNVPIPVQILVEAQAGDASLSIQSANATLIIRSSPAAPGEVGFASNQPSAVAPDSVAAKARATLLVSTVLICNNGPGDPGRVNEWSATVTFTTSAGVFNAETVDRLRVNIP